MRCLLTHDWRNAGEWREQECGRCGAGRYHLLREWVYHKPRATIMELVLAVLLAGTGAVLIAAALVIIGVA